jgi:hypothetical protein
LEPGLHKFEAFCTERGAKWEAKTFKIEAGITHYFKGPPPPGRVRGAEDAHLTDYRD